MLPKTPKRNLRRRGHAPVFAALGDDTRLAIVARLAEGQRCSIAELTQGTSVTRQAVTKHLRVLEEARIVRRARAGREVRFTLDAAPIREARDYAAMVSDKWDDALGRLKALVER
jgi:DNA-binding transcriptional ArsR family regulator